MSDGTRLFFVLMPPLLLPTAFFLAWLLPTLWKRLRHRAPSDSTGYTPGPEAEARSKAHARRA
ncbi:MAG TPA: hypothetical protein VHB47_03135 [Thermoanaerobaculia bacterium]|jgi:hypothetical protein|nr:hypothetical protein [Thermoanaerobaculia bacterium]